MMEWMCYFASASALVSSVRTATPIWWRMSRSVRGSLRPALVCKCRRYAGMIASRIVCINQIERLSKDSLKVLKNPENLE